MCDEITYPFPNFSGFTVEVWVISSHNWGYYAYDDLSILVSKLTHVSKRGPNVLEAMLMCLILSLLDTEFFAQIISISHQTIPWLFASPRHQRTANFKVQFWKL